MTEPQFFPEKISSFHTHTRLCKHADGMPVDYVKQAMLDGCCALGFSDHAPFPLDGSDWWPGVRMYDFQASGYVQSVRNAAELADFPVYCGFECEYDPKYNSWYKDFLREELGTDYLVLGNHWLIHNNEYVYIPEYAHEKKLLGKYTDQCIKAMESGLFAFMAHPDVFFARKPVVWNQDTQACSTAIIECAIANNLPLEINGNGYSRGVLTDKAGQIRCQYPIEQFWQIAKEKGARIICNSDAHSPSDVISFARLAREFAARLDIQPENFTL